jgi:hypothetical protein
MLFKEVIDGRNCKTRTLKFCNYPEESLGDQIKENEVGGACGTHGIGEKSVQVLGGESRRKETTVKTKA